MAGLGLALMNAASGYMRGREQRRQGEVEDQRYADQRARQAEQDARAREMMAAQVEQMRAAQQEREAARTRQNQMDMREASDRGEMPVDQVAAQGQNLAGAYGGANPLMDAATKALGAGLAQRAKTPAYQIGGTGYVKAQPSVREQEFDRAQTLADTRASEARAQHLADIKASQDFQRSQQDRLFGQQRALQDNSLEAQIVRAGAGKVAQPTESERRGAALLTMAQTSNDLMTKMGNPSFGDRAKNAVPVVGDAMMSQHGRQFRQAATSFARSYLYLVSGANATQQEAEALADQIVPSALDSEDTMASKAARRSDMLHAMQQVAGRAAPAQGAQNAPPAPSAPAPQSKYNDPGFLAYIRSRSGGRP